MEYKKEVATAVTIAIMLAALVGAAALYSFPPSAGSSTRVNTSQGTTASVTTTMHATTTIPSVQTYTNETVPFDPRLAVTPMRGLLETSDNATVIAEALASDLNELPVRLILHSPATCSVNSTASISGIPAGENCRELNYPYSTAIDFYLFKSAKGSNITVDLIQGRFLELQYIVQDYNTLYNDYFGNYTAGVSNPSPAVASVTVGNLMQSAFGIDLSKVSLANPYASEHWIRVDLTQQYNGMMIANSGEVYFEYYPPTSQVIRLIVEESNNWALQSPWSPEAIGPFVAQLGGWHLIPPNFPLNISAPVALDDAKTYATNALHMGSIGYASISLQMVQDHLYYAATVSNQTKTLLFFVNPITGQIGFPQTAPLTLNYSTMPSEFSVGAYSVIIGQGTDYYVKTGNGTEYDYLGFYTLFDITLNGQTQTVPFFWETPSGPSTSHPPYNSACVVQNGPSGCPYSATAFGGVVSIVWSEQNSTIYVTFTIN